MKGLWVLATVVLIWAVASTVAASYYYMQYDKYYGFYKDLSKNLGEVSISVNTLIDYGNGTKTWYNNTILPIGASVLNATIKVAMLNYSVSSYGAFVNSINGVWNNKDKNLWWLWYYWDSAELKWILGPVACNSYTLNDGSIVGWNYTESPY